MYMPRIRNIRPEFWNSDKVCSISIFARMLLIGMWNFCDDHGIHEASAAKLKAEVFPVDPFTLNDINQMIEELLNVGLIVHYLVNEVGYFQVADWEREQNSILKPKFIYPIRPENVQLSTYQYATSRLPVAYQYPTSSLPVGYQEEQNENIQNFGDQKTALTECIYKENNSIYTYILIISSLSFFNIFKLKINNPDIGFWFFLNFFVKDSASYQGEFGESSTSPRQLESNGQESHEIATGIEYSIQSISHGNQEGLKSYRQSIIGASPIESIVQKNKRRGETKKGLKIKTAKNDDVQKVFDYYREVMHSPRSVLSDARKALIKKWLPHYSVEDLKQAISAYAADEWFKERGKRDIEYLLRNAGNIERFITLYAFPPVKKESEFQRINRIFGVDHGRQNNTKGKENEGAEFDHSVLNDDDDDTPY